MNSNTPVFPGSHTAGIVARDWLAAMAMQGIIAKGLEVKADRAMTEDDKDDEIANRAYRLADAMIRVRSRSESTEPALSR